MNFLSGDYTIGENMNVAPQFGVDNSLAYTPQAGSTGPTLTSLLSNPAIQTAMLNFAGALDPNGFGGRLAKAGLTMRQSLSTAQANAQVNGGSGMSTSTPSSNTAPPTMTQGNVDDNAKALSRLGTFLKNAHQINPSMVPKGYENMFISALNAQPVIENPTQPASIGQTLAGDTQNAVQGSFNVPDALALSMTPEQVQHAYSQNIANREMLLREAALPGELAYKDAAREHMRWQMSPQRVEDQIRVNREQIMGNLDLYKGKQAWDIATAKDFAARNPALSNMEVPYMPGVTIGQLSEFAATNNAGADAMTKMIGYAVSFQEAQLRANAEMEAIRLRAQATGQEQEFIKTWGLYEKFNKDIAQYSNDMTEADWKKLTPQEQTIARLSGKTFRTPERQAALNDAIRAKRELEQRLFPQNASALAKAEDDLAASGASIQGNPIRVQADTSKLDEITRRTKGKPMWKFDVRSMFDYTTPNIEGVDPALLNSLIYYESGGDQNARSKKGAIGLTQLMPGTARDMGVNPFDPKDNVRGGAKYLKQLQIRYGGDLRKALAAYNWGYNNVDKYGYEGAPKSTKDYVNKVLAFYSKV